MGFDYCVVQENYNFCQGKYDHNSQYMLICTLLFRDVNVGYLSIRKNEFKFIAELAGNSDKYSDKFLFIYID